MSDPLGMSSSAFGAGDLPLSLFIRRSEIPFSVPGHLRTPDYQIVVMRTTRCDAALILRAIEKTVAISMPP